MIELIHLKILRDTVPSLVLPVLVDLLHELIRPALGLVLQGESSESFMDLTRVQVGYHDGAVFTYTYQVASLVL